MSLSIIGVLVPQAFDAIAPREQIGRLGAIYIDIEFNLEMRSKIASEHFRADRKSINPSLCGFDKFPTRSFWRHVVTLPGGLFVSYSFVSNFTHL